jgi:8-oxo-dGTP pyrophosphatase MutT (NUDIX family)
VLLLIYPRDGEDYMVFMRRTDIVEHHKGQISLPGGAEDPDDESPVATALREAQEELGIDPGAVEVMGTLHDVYARVSYFVITPVVARLKPEAVERELVFRPSPDEVAEVLEAPLRVLREEWRHHTEMRTSGNVTYNVHYYDCGAYIIWGVTGRILHEFLKEYPAGAEC